MRTIRKQFGAAIYRRIGGTGKATGAAAGPGVDADVRLADRIWFVLLVIMVFLTFLMVNVFPNSMLCQVILAGLWGLLIGGGILFICGKQLIITIFGALIGGGVAKAKSVADDVRQFAHSATNVTHFLNNIFGPSVHIYNGSVVIFFVLCGLSCLPAYRKT